MRKSWLIERKELRKPERSLEEKNLKSRKIPVQVRKTK